MNYLEKKSYIIQAGYLAISTKPANFCAVCGSGVVVIIWDRLRRTGGMAHCILSGIKTGEKPTNYHSEYAVPRLAFEILRNNSDTSELEAQLFGGAVENHSFKKTRHIVNSARKILRKMRINVVSEDVGGIVGRKVIFNTFSGEAMVLKTKLIRRSDWAPEYWLGYAKG